MCVCGPIDPPTWDGKNYAVTFMDDFTNFSQVELMKTKNEVSEKLKYFINEVENKWNSKTHKIRCDNGGEYSSNEIKDWCRKKGIILEYTTPYSPQLNGKAERLNRTLLDKARALIFDSGLGKEF